MQSKTSDEVRRQRNQRLLMMVGILLMPVVFLYTPVAHLQITWDRIRLLNSLATSRDPYKICMALGHVYADAGEYDKAVEFYRRALPYYRRTKLEELLQIAWEELDREDPFDPKMHIGFGEMFQSFGQRQQAGKFGPLQQAEMEYKQTLTLAPGNKEATARLAEIAALMLANRHALGSYPEWERRGKQYGPDLAAKWLPPAHQGCLVTRCGVFGDGHGHVNVSVVGQSGSFQHDRSAVSVLQAADFGRLFYYTEAGVYEFACMSEGDTKTIGFTSVIGECSCVETPLNERLSWLVQEILERINKQTGTLRL
jgi:hypothetical protein